MKKINMFLAFFSIAFAGFGCFDDSSANSKLVDAVKKAKQGNWQEAEQIAIQLSEENPAAVSPVILQILSFENSGQMDKAVDLARQCAKSNPQDFAALYTLGRLYSKDEKRYGEAYSMLENAIILRPGDINTLILLCNLGVVNNESTAGKYLDQLVLKSKLSNADTGRAYYLRGIYLDRSEKKEEAYRSMMKAWDYSIKDNPELLFQIAAFVEKTGHRDVEAGLLYKRFVQYYEKTAGYDPGKTALARTRSKRLLNSR